MKNVLYQLVLPYPPDVFILRTNAHTAYKKQMLVLEEELKFTIMFPEVETTIRKEQLGRFSRRDNEVYELDSLWKKDSRKKKSKNGKLAISVRLTSQAPERRRRLRNPGLTPRLVCSDVC